MSSTIDFMEFVSKNDDVRKEMEALRPELVKMDEEGRFDAFKNFAAKYGFTFTENPAKHAEIEELSDDELEAVAGGGCGWTSYSCCGYPVWMDELF